MCGNYLETKYHEKKHYKNIWYKTKQKIHCIAGLWLTKHSSRLSSIKTKYIFGELSTLFLYLRCITIVYKLHAMIIYEFDNFLL